MTRPFVSGTLSKIGTGTSTSMPVIDVQVVDVRPFSAFDDAVLAQPIPFQFAVDHVLAETCGCHTVAFAGPVTAPVTCPH